jgi:folate-dependent tRNA-U54 methylase TrmFO/GidA
MNIQSEIEFFSDLGLVDKARFVTRLMLEVAEQARLGGGDGTELQRHKFANEMTQRLARFAYQLLSEDASRPHDDVVIRMLLGARTDKNAERMMHNAYRRVLLGFESFDTTVLINPR